MHHPSAPAFPSSTIAAAAAAAAGAFSTASVPGHAPAGTSGTISGTVSSAIRSRQVSVSTVNNTTSGSNTTDVTAATAYPGATVARPVYFSSATAPEAGTTTTGLIPPAQVHAQTHAHAPNSYKRRLSLSAADGDDGSPGSSSATSQQNGTDDGPAIPPDQRTKKRRMGATGARGVASLTPEQLAKKRANDREAQRAIRERTKNQIEALEARIRELTSQKPYQELQKVVRQKEAVEAENAQLKATMASIVGIIQPFLSGSTAAENAYVSPVPTYVSVQSAEQSQPEQQSKQQQRQEEQEQEQEQERDRVQQQSLAYQAIISATCGDLVSPYPALSSPPHSQALINSPRRAHAFMNTPPNIQALINSPPHSEPSINSTPRHQALISSPRMAQPLSQSNPLRQSDSQEFKAYQQRQDFNAYLDIGADSDQLQFDFLLDPSQRINMMRPGYSGTPDTSTYQLPLKPSWVTPAVPGFVNGLPDGPPPSLPSSPPPVPSPQYIEYRAAQMSPSRPLAGAGVSGPLRHCPPVCILDNILLDFLHERRIRAAEGLSTQALLGPKYPTVASLINPAISSQSLHPLCKVFTDVLKAFSTLRGIPEKVAILYLMFMGRYQIAGAKETNPPADPNTVLLVRWEISPTDENWELLPPFARPNPSQFTHAHPAWIDHLPFPAMREKLVHNYMRPELSFELFVEPYTTTFSINWPYEATDALLEAPGGNDIIINPVFQRHLFREENWTLGSEFDRVFPSLRGTYNLKPDGPAPLRMSMRPSSRRGGDNMTGYR
ncbi:hypothetical protein GGR50DRAFT_697016 [Xylaria sp. CBS 124048]|nr:hypothetical protein GGR50DRAFT_697016 [Xylaria sp. CBS 124048]